MDLDALMKQYRGRKFGELILHHRKKMDLRTCVAGMQGTVDLLPESARGLVESWIDEMNIGCQSEEFWQQNCGEALDNITSAAQEKLSAVGIQPSSDDLFNMFQIIVMNFAYSTHLNPKSKSFIQKALGHGFFRRLLG